MRDISGKMRSERIRQLTSLIKTYQKALKKTNNKESIRNLNMLISNAEKNIEDLK